MLTFGVDVYAEGWNMQPSTMTKWEEGIGDQSLPFPVYLSPASRILSYEVTNGKGFTISPKVMCYFRFQQGVVR